MSSPLAVYAAPLCRLGDPLFAERYRAIDARDRRFDGQFTTAVLSTGIYCRPSCPARTPKPANVVFYLTPAAAQEAGFRACKRCLPEAAPGTPEWDLRRDVAGRAMRLISDGLVDREGVSGLAARLGYTPRHVTRLLRAELGAPPLALVRARRAQSARALLVGTELPLDQVAFAAGFGSVRQFNDTVRAVFDAAPSDLRSRFSGGGTAALSPAPARADAAPEAPASNGLAHSAVRLDLELPVRHPFDARGVFEFLAVRAVAGVECAELTAERLRYARTVRLPSGIGAFAVTATRTSEDQWRIRLELELADLSDVAPAVARVRRMLDLDADPVSVDAALGADAALAPLVARTPGIRVPGTVDPEELVIRALVGQQISVAAARGHLGRLAEAAGTPYRSSFPGLSTVFPSSAQIAAQVPRPASEGDLDRDRPLRLPRQAISAVIAAAEAMADGTLAVHVGADADELRAALVARPRIGPWTAAYVAMRVLGDPDAWLDGDVALIAGARARGLLPSESTTAASHSWLRERATAWAPWRSYAAMHLWQAASSAAISRKER